MSDDTSAAGPEKAGPNTDPTKSEPKKRLWVLLKKWGGSLVIFIMVLALGWNLWTDSSLAGTPARDGVPWLNGGLIATIVICFFIGWFLYAFTSCFPGKDWEERTKGKGVVWERRIAMVSFSYIFTIVFLLFPLWSHILISPVSHRGMFDVPMGLVVGCVVPSIEDPTATPVKADLKSVPKELRCGANTDQWLVNVGGTIIKGVETSASPKGSVEIKPNKTDKKSAPAGTVDSPKSLSENLRPTLDFVQIRGGLVVPLYFIALSLMGAAVSLARRVPEIQRQSEHDYVGTPNEPKLLPGDVRERLAFQIMQFISAPLIAVTAYHAVAPETKIASVALGFTAGFASESILLMIRGVVDGIKPRAVTPQPAKGAASGVIVDKSHQPVAKAAVTVIGQPALKAESDDHGLFVINSVPVGEQVIDAAMNNQNAKVKVIIESGRTSVCHIELG